MSVVRHPSMCSFKLRPSLVISAVRSANHEGKRCVQRCVAVACGTNGEIRDLEWESTRGGGRAMIKSTSAEIGET